MEADLEPLEWVSWKMKGFCKLVGFPIVKHEAKCLALFQLLEEEWVDLENSGIPR